MLFKMIVNKCKGKRSFFSLQYLKKGILGTRPLFMSFKYNFTYRNMSIFMQLYSK